MTTKQDKEPQRVRRPDHTRHHYRQARLLKRLAAALVQSVPHAIIERGAR